MRRVLRIVVGCAALLMPMACSCTAGSGASAMSSIAPSGSVGQSQFTGAGPASTGQSPSTLPGEPLDVAFRRLLYACMDAFGETNFQVVMNEGNGVRYEGRSYSIESQQSQAHHAECVDRARRAVPPPTLTREQLGAAYGQMAKVMDCIRKAGFDIGTTVSLEEFIAKAGDVPYTSRYDPSGFGPDLARCSELFPPPPGV